MKSLMLMSASSWPRPITIRWSAVSAISLIRWRGDEDRTALGRERLHQVAHPEDALGVEAVDRLVEEQHLGVAEQRGGDAEPLAHAEREALGALPGHVLEADDAEHLVHPAGRDAGQLGQAQQVVAGAAGRRARPWRRGARRPGGARSAACGRGSRRSSPGPEVGLSRPRIIRIVVDLPEPFGPEEAR